MEKKIDDKIREEFEDSTKYGEFISSYFVWLPLQEQKKNVEKLEELTKNKEQ